MIDALYEAGEAGPPAGSAARRHDALVGHRRLDFARRADTWEAALRSARADAESVPGVHIVAVKIDAQDIEAAPNAGPASADDAAETGHRGRRSAAAIHL